MNRKFLSVKCWTCKTKRTFHLSDETVCPRCGAGREWVPQLEALMKLQLETLENLEKEIPKIDYARNYVLFECRECGLTSVVRVKERLKCKKCKKPMEYKCWNCKQPIKQPFHICSRRHWFICQSCGACCCMEPKFPKK